MIIIAKFKTVSSIVVTGRGLSRTIEFSKQEAVKIEADDIMGVVINLDGRQFYVRDCDGVGNGIAYIYGSFLETE